MCYRFHCTERAEKIAQHLSMPHLQRQRKPSQKIVITILNEL